MQIYPISCTLKKDWISHRGRLFHAGTTFKRTIGHDFPERADGPGYWYDFKFPNSLPLPHPAGCFGFVFIPNRIFYRLSEEEKNLRVLREAEREKHIRLCDPFNS